MGALVAIEGIDGSGKGTQAARLHARLLAEGVQAALISFPRYDATRFGRAVGEFLNGRFGALDDVSPFLVSLLYAGDRFESRQFLLDALGRNDFVVLDRYVESNIAHQGAKVAGEERDELVNWIAHVEYSLYRLPSPDLVILLDLPAERAQRLIARKRQRSYTDKKADLQEADAAYLERVREVYLERAAAEQRWHKVDCMQDGTLRSVEDIGDEIWHAVRSLCE